MRQIRFRGKDIKTGRWVYGYYAVQYLPDMSDDHQTVEGFHEVHAIYNDEPGNRDKSYWTNADPKTIGQFTGLHDINGKEIYEGDIVTMKRTPEGRSMSVTSRHVVTSHSVTDWDFHSLAKEILSFSMCNFHEEYSIYNHRVEVIGNIHDNPELAQPYSLNLPERKPRKRKNNKIDVVLKFKI